MPKPATSRLKMNPPLGRMPVLQFCAPEELEVDPTYQRSVEGKDSQALIRKLAQYWNWDLCLPLVVSRRRIDAGERLFVIDGQHRLAAALQRGDIPQLPCMVKEYASAADEAASFVHLNQQRRPLGKIDLFKAAVASEDPQAVAILDAIETAGLSIAPHLTSVAWKPGMIGNIGGVEAAWRSHGEPATRLALSVLADAFAGQVLRYAGTIFPGIAAVCADEGTVVQTTALSELLGERDQTQWRSDILRARSDDPNLKFARASAKVIREAWAARRDSVQRGSGRAGHVAAPPPPPPPASPPKVARATRQAASFVQDGTPVQRMCRACGDWRSSACGRSWCPLGVAANA